MSALDRRNPAAAYALAAPGLFSAVSNRSSPAMRAGSATAAAVGSQPYRSTAVWSVPASTAASSAVRFAPSSAYSGTRPTSPGWSGRAGAVPGTVRVCRSAADSAADDASIPSLIHTASPRLPAATMPSPEPFGSRTASRTPPGAATSFDSASQLPPALVSRAAVAVSVTM